ncbi:MAG: hypothetical protein Q9213_004574 [Squamulea squamosa]
MAQTWSLTQRIRRNYKAAMNLPKRLTKHLQKRFWKVHQKRLSKSASFVRKDPKDGEDADKYFISAGFTKPNDKFPGSANEGSSSGPQPAREDSISFIVKMEGDGDSTQDVIIITPPLNGGQLVEEVDNAPLTFKGFPITESQFDTSQDSCDVGEYHDANDQYSQERLPFGDKWREIRCFM